MMQKPLPVLALAAAAMAAGSCPSDSPLSCHNATAVADTCCFIPAGQLLQTQFWDTDPPTGPSDSWTIHGLWPDNCDGSYPAQCDTDRAYTNITQILQANDAGAVLDYMGTYWKDYRGDDESFWEHEWGKHGTCISTLEPSCYGDAYRDGEEAADFFARAVGLFQTLPTVLSKKHGAQVTLNCRGKVFNEVWYHYNVRGSLQDGDFVAAPPDGAKSKCKGKVQYKPKA
ncbi:ribonuclease M [Cordyceps militaris]|uniref:ribonuclease T2 n=1 Tax=Cordyceps militaris TaxID=73501 RepID=A0A2H4SLV9_CORMI|nr:ribonuclease M [Cordyceps militaris]